MGSFRILKYLRWLLWLNPGARGEHLTSQFSWVAAWLLVTHVCFFYLVEELVLVFYVPLWLGWCIMVVLLMFYLHGEYGYSSVGSYCYSREWLWNTRAKIGCMDLGKWNTSRVSPQEFDIRYIVFSVNQFERVSVV